MIDRGSRKNHSTVEQIRALTSCNETVSFITLALPNRARTPMFNSYLWLAVACPDYPFERLYADRPKPMPKAETDEEALSSDGSANGVEDVLCGFKEMPPRN